MRGRPQPLRLLADLAERTRRYPKQLQAMVRGDNVNSTEHVRRCTQRCALTAEPPI